MRVKKIISFDEELAKAVQHYANHNYNGNFTKAVQEMCRKVTEEAKES